MFFWIVIKAPFVIYRPKIYYFHSKWFSLAKSENPMTFCSCKCQLFFCLFLKMWRSRLQLFGVFKKCKLTKNNFLNDLISVWQYTLKNLNTNGVDFNINQTFFDLPLWKMEWVNLMDFIHPTAFPFILVKKSPFTGK